MSIVSTIARTSIFVEKFGKADDRRQHAPETGIRAERFFLCGSSQSVIGAGFAGTAGPGSAGPAFTRGQYAQPHLLFLQFIACGALPCATWLDGTSAGERDIEELLELLIVQGTVALSIVPIATGISLIPKCAA